MPYLRGSSTPRRRRQYAVITPASRGYLRARTRTMGLTSRSRYASYRQRKPKLRSKRYLRRFKAYRRTLPASRSKTRAVSTPTTGVALDNSGSALAPTPLGAITNNNVNCAMGRIYLKLLPAPTIPASGLGNMRTRQSNFVLYHGIKINRTFALPYGERIPTSSVCVNWALVQFKRNAYEDVTEPLPSELNMYKDFFRDHASNNTGQDSIDFPAYTSTGTGADWNHEMNVLAMNPDNNYNIITHRRFILTDKGGTSGVNNGGPGKQRHQWNQCWMKNINFYYKLNKTLSFTNSTDVNPEQPIAEIWWYNSVCEDAKPADISISTTFYLNTFCKNVVYFSDEST